MTLPGRTPSSLARGALGIAVLGVLLSGCARPPQGADLPVPSGALAQPGPLSTPGSAGSSVGEPGPVAGGVPAPTAVPTSAPTPAPGAESVTGVSASSTPPATPAAALTAPTAPTGDARRVRVSGSFEVRPDGTVLMCPAIPQAAAESGAWPGEDTGCLQGVPTLGLDTGGPDTAGGTADGGRWGQVGIDAWWDGRSFVVIDQGPPDQDRDTSSGWPGRVPCPEPEGGWSSDDLTWQLEQDTLRTAVGPSYAGHRSVYPDGPPVDGIGRKVTVIGTTGDPAAADAAVRAVYSGNICVTAAGWDAATVDRQFERFKLSAIGGAVGQSPAHVYSFGIGMDADGNPRMIVGLIEVTPDVQALLTELGEPAPIVDAWIRPVG